MNKAKYLIIILLVVLSGAVGFYWTKNKQGDILGKNGNPKTAGDFLITDKEICEEDGKPIIYFFGSSSCPHCVWEKPIAKKVFDQFKNEISYHENFDSSEDSDVFTKFQPYLDEVSRNSIPFLILGCKYVRVGAGEQLGTTDEESQKLEEEALTAIVCKLTSGKPGSVCDSAKDKTSEVK